MSGLHEVFDEVLPALEAQGVATEGLSGSVVSSTVAVGTLLSVLLEQVLDRKRAQTVVDRMLAAGMLEPDALGKADAGGTRGRVLQREAGGDATDLADAGSILAKAGRVGRGAARTADGEAARRTKGDLGAGAGDGGCRAIARAATPGISGRARRISGPGTARLGRSLGRVRRSDGDGGSGRRSASGGTPRDLGRPGAGRQAVLQAEGGGLREVPAATVLATSRADRAGVRARVAGKDPPALGEWRERGSSMNDKESDRLTWRV